MTQPAVDYGKGDEIPCESAAAITQFSTVVLSAGTNGMPVATMTAATTDKVFGVSQTAATAAGQTVSVRYNGTSLYRVAAGVTMAPGTRLSPTATAGAVTGTGGTDFAGMSMNHENVAAAELFPGTICPSENA